MNKEIVIMLVVGLAIILLLGAVRDLLARRKEAKLYSNDLPSEKIVKK